MKKLFVIALITIMIFSFFGCSADKDFAKVETLTERLVDFEMKNVTLLDSYEKNAFRLETEYLKSLDADRLLKGFCERAGV